MFFTTAKAFCMLLSNNGIPVTQEAAIGLSMFCGDEGYRAIDNMSQSELSQRLSDPNRYYWEELSQQAQKDWHKIFTTYQDEISLLLFQKTYKGDAFCRNHLFVSLKFLIYFVKLPLLHFRRTKGDCL